MQNITSNKIYKFKQAGIILKTCLVKKISAFYGFSSFIDKIRHP